MTYQHTRLGSSWQRVLRATRSKRSERRSQKPAANATAADRSRVKYDGTKFDLSTMPGRKQVTVTGRKRDEVKYGQLRG